ncbi:hypothetical protein RchiOBHm_Chr2g0086761 [Rosa chinensis]|uniref:Uncharacterized protein n=1 Tax=Rosa chinensis TaxID=74649 RepID=A0A2P6RII4_ROSCH|nr:hypothetical protein RchiOBHm_Chr2g0086761 [Rosa chinensis]
MISDHHVLLPGRLLHVLLPGHLLHVLRDRLLPVLLGRLRLVHLDRLRLVLLDDLCRHDPEDRLRVDLHEAVLLLDLPDLLPGVGHRDPSSNSC